MTDLHREAPLYDQRFPVTFPSEDQPKDSLVLRILEGSQPSQVVGQNEKVFHFEVTDDRDPYFLFYFDISESDFPQFKREQAFAVEFAAFPSIMIQLFDLCTLSVNGPIGIRGADPSVSPKFYQNAHSLYTARLDPSTGLFSISETNKIKTTTHLLLPMKAGDDCSIKMYLATRLSLALKVSMDQSAVIDRLREENGALHDADQRMTEDLRRMSTHKELELQSIKNAHNAEVNALQQAHMQQVTEMRDKYSLELQESKLTLDRVRSDLERRCHELEQTLSATQYERTSLEHKLEALQREKILVEKDRKKYMDQAEELLAKLSDQETRLHGMDTANLSLRHEIDTLKHMIDQRDKIIQNFENTQRVYDENKSINEQKYASFHQSIQDLNENIARLKEELKERNQRIKELETEARANQNHFSEQAERIRSLSSSLEDVQSKLQAAQATIQQQALTIQTQSDEAETLRAKLRTFDERIKASDDTILQNELVIKHLQKELNDQQLGERAFASSGLGDCYPRPHPPMPMVHSVSPDRFQTPAATGFSSQPPLTTMASMEGPLGGTSKYTPSTVGYDSVHRPMISRPAAVDEVVARYSSPTSTQSTPLYLPASTASATLTPGYTPTSTFPLSSKSTWTSQATRGTAVQGFAAQFKGILSAYPPSGDSSLNTSAGDGGKGLLGGATGQGNSNSGVGAAAGRVGPRSVGPEEPNIDLSAMSYYKIVEAKSAESPPHKKKPVDLRDYF